MMNHILYDVWNKLSNFPRVLDKNWKNKKNGFFNVRCLHISPVRNANNLIKNRLILINSSLKWKEVLTVPAEWLDSKLTKTNSVWTF